MSQDFTVVQPGASLKDWRDPYNDNFDALLTSNKGAVAPTYAKAGTWWDSDVDDDPPSLVYHMKIYNKAGDTWHKVFRRDEDFGGLLDRYGGNAMAEKLDHDGYDIVLDTDGDTKIVGDQDAGVSDDEFALQIGGVSPAIRLKIDGTHVNFKPTASAALQIKDPKTDGTTTVGSPAGRVLIDIGGTEYAFLFNDKT